jgi:hypothetical protein
MERLMAHAGLKTKSEFVSHALALFRWASNELANGRQTGSSNPDGTAFQPLDMPCLQAFSRITEEFDRLRPSPEELLARSKQPGIPAEQVLAEMRKLLVQANGTHVFFPGSQPVGLPVSGLPTESTQPV